MVDINEIISALDNLKPYQQKAIMKINRPGIVSSIPNYKTEKLLSNVGKVSRAGGMLGVAVPLYKDVFFPIANDLYRGFIKGDIDNSKALQMAVALAGINKSNNNIKGANTNNGNDYASVPTKDLEGLEILDENKLTGGKLIQVPTNRRIANAQQQPIQIAKQAVQSSVQPSEQTNEQTDAEALNAYMQQLRDVNQPYIDALQSYYNNYDNMLKEYQARKRYWQGISSITKNPRWSEMAEAYNPVSNEATKVALVKQIQDAKASDINAINEIIGNMEVATKGLGLSPKSAFANKNLLTALSTNNRYLNDLEKAKIMADIKRYGYDKAYDKAMAQQLLRNKGMVDVANIYANPYGYINSPAPGLNQQGFVQQSYNPLQVSQPQLNKYDELKARLDRAEGR